MPVESSGGPIHIAGGYNDVGHDMYNGHNYIRYENSNNAIRSAVSHSFNDSSMNKHSPIDSENGTGASARQPNPQQHAHQASGQVPPDILKEEAERQRLGGQPPCVHQPERFTHQCTMHDEAVLKEAFRIMTERQQREEQQKREKEEAEKSRQSKNPFDQRNYQWPAQVQSPPQVQSNPLPNPYRRNLFAPQGDPPPVYSPKHHPK